MRAALGFLIAATALAQRVEFPHGVASGDVSPSSVLLWTRTSGEAALTYQVADSPAFDTILHSGQISADASGDFTAKALVSGLAPGRVYHYRWIAAGGVSETGTFRTAPAPGQPAPVRFAFSGDSDSNHGGFDLLDTVGRDAPDFFLYLGDTIYADSEHRRGGPARTLEQYRDAYRANRDVAALRRLMAAMPVFTMWDDHEVQDGWAGATVDRSRFAAAQQAFLEYMPLRPRPVAAGEGCAGVPLYRSFVWGSEVHLILLDTRTCRGASAAPACTAPGGSPDWAPLLTGVLRMVAGLPLSPPRGCVDAISDPSRTLLGATQKRWLKQTIEFSPARFKIVVTSVPIFSFYGHPYDRWEGYPAERAEVLAFLRDRGIPNVLFITTDLHSNLIAPVAMDPVLDRAPLFHEIVAGPIATLPLEPKAERFDPGGAAAVNRVFDVVQVECRQMNAYGYGLVEVDGGRLRVSLRGADGRPFRDQRDPAKTCEKTFE